MASSVTPSETLLKDPTIIFTPEKKGVTSYLAKGINSFPECTQTIVRLAASFIIPVVSTGGAAYALGKKALLLSSVYIKNASLLGIGLSVLMVGYNLLGLNSILSDRCQTQKQKSSVFGDKEVEHFSIEQLNGKNIKDLKSLVRNLSEFEAPISIANLRVPVIKDLESIGEFELPISIANLKDNLWVLVLRHENDAKAYFIGKDLVPKEQEEESDSSDSLTQQASEYQFYQYTNFDDSKDADFVEASQDDIRIINSFLSQKSQPSES